MKNLIIALIGILGVTSVTAQTDIFDDPSVKRQWDSITAISNKTNAEFPTYKTGDDNSQLIGLFKNIITDPIAKHLFSIDPSLNQLHITGYNTRKRVDFNTWLSSLDPSLYPNAEFTIKYGGDEQIEHLYIYNSKNEVVREIMIIWDKSFDGTSYTNIRTIKDTYFNE